MKGKLAKPLDTQRSHYGRSRVTNNSSLFADRAVDARGTWPRRFQDIYGLHLADLGGLEKTTEAQRSLIRRITYLSVELEQMENARAKGEPVDLASYLSGSNALNRLIDSLGIKNVEQAKEAQPTFADILKAAKEEKAAKKAPPGQDLIEAAE